MTKPAPFAENVRGIVLICLCQGLFLGNDTLIKLVSEDLPLTQIIFFRGMMATAVLVPLAWWMGALRSWRVVLVWPVFWRTFSEIAAAYTFLTALLHIPIGNANAIGQVTPLMITAAGAIFLGERVGWRRWTAIVVGFLGVLVIIRPGLDGFTAFSLLAVASAGFITMRDILSRLLPAHVPNLLLATVTAFVVGTSGPVLAPVFGQTWVTPTPQALGIIACAVAFVTGAYLTAFEYMRHGDISVVAPFRYTVIVMAVAVGFVVWGEIPDIYMIIGTAIIAATGIYTFSRERNMARLRAEAAAGEGL